MSIRDFHSFYLRAIFPVRVALFPSGMIYITNIKSIYRNNTFFYSGLNVEHVGEGFVSIWQIGFELWTCKVEKLPISRKFDL